MPSDHEEQLTLVPVAPEGDVGAPTVESGAEPKVTAAPTRRATTRIALTVAYDGSGYHGFWPNDGVATVGGTLLAAIEQVIDAPTAITCAGRTDTGVHAWGQVVTFDAPAGVVVADLQQSLNALCGPTIAVRKAETVADDFDARSSAVARCYRYTVLNRPVPDPFLTTTTWHMPHPLDLSLLRLGCDALIGHLDFTSFCRKGPPLASGEPRSLMRRVTDARWVDLGDGLLRFDIEASSFCHTMVRSIVGTLVAMGEGRLRPGDMMGIIAARDRHAVPALAPPHGLCLWKVKY